MRNVVSSSEVYHLWIAEAQVSARNSSSSVSFDGDTAYSYRAPIGRIVRNREGFRAVLRSGHQYSVTTSKHQSYLWRAIPSDVQVFTLETLDRPFGWGNDRAEDYGVHVASYQSRIAEAQGKAKRARSSKEYREQDVARLITEARAFCTFFGLDLSAFSEYNLTLIAERAEAAKAEERKREAEAGERRRKALAEAVPQWLAGGAVSIHNHPETFLRAGHDRDGVPIVETSRGAIVPMTAARVLFTAWERGNVPVGLEVGHYRVISSTPNLLTIGCHELKRVEILRFAEARGWAMAQERAA